MAERLDKEFSLLSTDTLSFPSSHSSTMSFSGFNRTESTSSRIEIYDWILLKIEEEKIARFVDRHEGIYELDWKEVVVEYLQEFYKQRGDDNTSPQEKDVGLRKANNSLRSALLNNHRKKGAAEVKKLNMGSTRWFKLPSDVINKLARTTSAVSKVNESHSSAVTVVTEKVESNLGAHGGEKAINESARHLSKPPLMASMDFNPFSVDPEFQDKYLPKSDYGPFPKPIGDNELLPYDEAGRSHYGEESSGYGTGSDKNLVIEMDPCEGPFKGGDLTGIFLEKCLSTRYPGVKINSMCKVVFSSSNQKLGEVQGKLRNGRSITFKVPPCPGRTEEQRARGMFTVEVVAMTQEGSYIGETSYTYKSN